MNNMQKLFEETTGKSALSDFSASENYVKWLEVKLLETSKEFCFQAEKLAFYDKCGNIYYDCKRII
jgi:hypothetical protein